MKETKEVTLTDGMFKVKYRVTDCHGFSKLHLPLPLPFGLGLSYIILFFLFYLSGSHSLFHIHALKACPLAARCDIFEKC